MSFAYKSIGYLHEDEHYQIIEFANFKLGHFPMEQLAWEYKASIRPGLQPLICFIAFKVAQLFGINDGFTLIFILRIIASTIALFVISNFIAVYKKYVVPSWRWLYICTSYFLWFIPYLNVRFSSENLSGLMLLYALVLFDKSNRFHNIKLTQQAGIILGLSVLFRFQSALFIVGLLAWLIFTTRSPFVKIFNLILGMAGVFLLGILIDYWLYGFWTITAVNYFEVNLIKGVASSFGTSPFYQYLFYIFNASSIFGSLLLVAFLLVWIFYSKNILIWICLPFIIVHSAIPHKELRFLFPIINLCPLILILCCQKIVAASSKIFSSRIREIVYRVGFYVIILINLAYLYAIGSTSANSGKFSVANYINANYKQNNLEIILVGSAYPFIDFRFIHTSYYSISGYNARQAINLWQKGIVNKSAIKENLILIIKENEISGPVELAHLKALRFKKVHQSIPDLTMLLYSLYDPSLKSNQTFVYKKY